MSQHNRPTIGLMEAQLEFLMADEPKFLGLMGSYRSGKTKVACIKAIRLASQNIGYDGLMLEPTHSMIQGVLVPAMEETLQDLGWSEEYKYKGLWYELTSSSGNPRFQLHFPNGDVVIYLRSSENWERIRGFSLAWFIADEFDTSGYDICHQAWQKMVSRLTSGNVMQGCVTSTKEGFQWAYKFFEEGKYRIIPASGQKIKRTDRKMIDIYVRDNPFIDQDYIEMMREQLSAKQFEAYVENKFINFAEGNVYYSYDREKNRSKATINKDLPAHVILHVGVDFNIGKMATVVGFILNGALHIVDEIYGCQTTEHLIAELKKRYPGRFIKCFVDSSGSSAQSNFTAMSLTDVQQLKRAFGDENVHHYKGHIPIADRIGVVNQKFCAADGKTRGLFINDERCPKLTNCIEQQGYVDGKPDKANDVDHMPDALGYIVSYIWAPQQHRAKIKVLT